MTNDTARWERTYTYRSEIIDIHGRSAPAWMLAHAENAKVAEALLADTVANAAHATASAPSCGLALR